MRHRLEQAEVEEAFVGAVVCEEARVLVLQADSGTWVLPEGRVRRSETLDQAVVREVLDESGLAVTLVEALGTTQRRHGDSSGSLVHETVHWFLTTPTGRSLRIEYPFIGGGLEPSEEALALLTFPTQREALLTALARLSGCVESAT